MKSLRIFIACAPQDFPFAQELRAHLAAAGLRPWLEETNLTGLPPGLERVGAIRQAIDRSEAMLVLLSPYALAAPDLRQEWLQARQQRKPILLLSIQGISPAEFLKAIEPIPSEPHSPPDGELLHWIDVRDRPLQAAWLALAWLKDRSGSRSDFPPAPVARARFYAETIPLPARLTAWGQLALMALGLPLALWGLQKLVSLQLDPQPAVFLDQFFISLLSLASVLGVISLAWIGRNGVETFRRRCKPLGLVLLPIQRLLFIVAALIVVLGLATNFLGKTALLHGFLHPSLAIVLGLAFASLAGVLFLPGLLVGHSRQMRAWLPRQQTAWLEAPLPAYPAALGGYPATPSPTASGVKTNGGKSGAAHLNGVVGKPPPRPAPSRLYLPRRFRLSLSPSPAQPAFATAASAFGLIHSLNERPAHQVSVLFAPQDAPFGRSLERYLVENGLRVHGDVAELVQAHVNARINLGASNRREDGSLVLVLSPWTKETGTLREFWQSAQAAGAPILPVLLEDTAIPNEFHQLPWVDARRDIPRARQQVLEAVLRVREKLPAVLPLQDPQPASEAAAAKGRLAVLPQSVQLAQFGLFFSSVIKLIFLAILFPMALWMAPSLNPGQWLSAGLLVSATYIQLSAVVLFFMRRLSYPWMMLIQGDCFLVGLVTIPFLQSDVFWPVSSLALLALFFPLWEAAVFGWLLFVTEIRHWALGGFWLRLRQLRVSAQTLFYSLAPLIIALLFLLPAFKTGPAPALHTSAGWLESGETALVRILPQSPPEIWTFSAARGDLVTIQADGGFNTSQLQFYLARRYRFLAQSQSTLGGATITTYRLPEDGDYEIHMVGLPTAGLFRITLNLQHPPLLGLDCGQPRLVSLGLGEVLAWTLPASQGDTFQLRLDAINWDLDPTISLYDPSGNLVASDDDGGRLLNASIPSLYTSQTGAYTLLTRGQPGTSGESQLTLLCSR